jgi:Tfp pilus assembly protein PilN
MIRVNLLYSLHERSGGVVADVERKVSSPLSRLTVSAAAVGILFVLFVGWDVVSSQMAVSDAQERLGEQKKIETQLAAVMKEQKDLEQKIQSVESRIAAIQRLRSTQAGPSSVLDAIRERIANTPGLFLESITQKGGELEIKGSSTDESVVTRFGRSLEFSSGLFSNLSIETQRKEASAQKTSSGDAPTGAPEPEVVNFTIRCAYTPGGKPAEGATVASGTSAAPQTEGGRPAPVVPQMAQNK